MKFEVILILEEGHRFLFTAINEYCAAEPRAKTSTYDKVLI